MHTARIAGHVGGSAELVDLAVASAEENGTRLGQLSGGVLDRGDQASFLDANIPAIFLHRSDDPNYHTVEVERSMSMQIAWPRTSSSGHSGRHGCGRAVEENVERQGDMVAPAFRIYCCS